MTDAIYRASKDRHSMTDRPSTAQRAHAHGGLNDMGMTSLYRQGNLAARPPSHEGTSVVLIGLSMAAVGALVAMALVLV